MAAIFVRNLPILRLIPVDNVLADKATYYAIDLFLKGADALYVSVAADLGLPIVTWDKEILERGPPIVVADRPDQLLPP